MNTHMIITFVVLAITVVMYCWEKIPIAMTTMLALLAMAFTGVLTFEEAFSGFASSSVMLIAGVSIIGNTFFEVGLAQKIGEAFLKRGQMSEKRFVITLFFVAALFSALFSNTAVTAMFIPLITSVSASSGGRISNKQTFMPLGIASVLGGNLTFIGSAASMVMVSGMLEESYYGKGISFFDPARNGLPVLLAAGACYILFVYRLQEKWFDFDEVAFYQQDKSENEMVYVRWKMILTAVVTAVCIVCWIFGLFNIGGVALLGATILICTKAADQRTVFKKVHWETVIIVGGAIGLAKAMEVSGAGEMIAHRVLGLFGTKSNQTILVMAAILIIATLLSNIMSNTACVAMLTPICIHMAFNMGCDAKALVMASYLGAHIALSTPICTPPMTMVSVTGYRFKDYFRVGGIINLVAIVVGIAATWIGFF